MAMIAHAQAREPHGPNTPKSNASNLLPEISARLVQGMSGLAPVCVSANAGLLVDRFRWLDPVSLCRTRNVKCRLSARPSDHHDDAARNQNQKNQAPDEKRY
eukprot:131182-Rhodomonas_salina.3